jgi:hypothetical protein
MANFQCLVDPHFGSPLSTQNSLPMSAVGDKKNFTNKNSPSFNSPPPPLKDKQRRTMLGIHLELFSSGTNPRKKLNGKTPACFRLQWPCMYYCRNSSQCAGGPNLTGDNLNSLWAMFSQLLISQFCSIAH